MAQFVTWPLDRRQLPDGSYAGGWWHAADDPRRIVCDLCPRGCRLGPGARGFCFVRQNCDGQMVSTTYGRSTGFCIDPIEKKPLNQFYPGTAVLSFGTAGCNLGCKFCQNWSSSKSRQVDAAGEAAAPEAIAQAAVATGCRSVAFTYNDPVVWAEYAIDTADACHALGVKTVAVTAGYIRPEARGPFFRAMDAANVDLKGFSEDFYFKLSSGHLEPVLQTLRWLVHESDVWVELTNLVIPQANDTPDEIARMCDWIVRELGPEVPLHFTAFHPDFRLTDRPPTPLATLRQAHALACQAGLKYVYTGNLRDQEHQSTYCPDCHARLMERDGYTLGHYGLEGNRCRNCGATVAGRYDATAGAWGARRQPIHIADYAKTVAKRPVPAADRLVPERPIVDTAGETRIFLAAGQRVAATVQRQGGASLRPALAELGELSVLGAFVSLKRGGQLRSCCGFLGQSIPLHEALEHAADRAAKDDPRFPPISPTELDDLDMEVWLLWGLEPVRVLGEDRVRAVTIGRHGLQIARGNARGLLLPGVAVEHGLDARSFLEQVCYKAGLPRDAWKEDETRLFTFEGYAIHGRLAETLVGLPETAAPPGPSSVDLTRLASHCQQNLLMLVEGGTPLVYLPNGFDGSVCGVNLALRVPGYDLPQEASRMGLRAELPLQATLFELVQAVAMRLRTARLPVSVVASSTVELSVFWDTALHGSLSEANLGGVNAQQRAVLVHRGGQWVLAFDPERTAPTLAATAAAFGQFHDPSRVAVVSLAVRSTRRPLLLCNIAAPQAGPEVRPPAVAGRFYPGSVAEIEQWLSSYFPHEAEPRPWSAVLVPHAGWLYSGQLAAETFRRVAIPSRVIVVAPKHTAPGAPWAVAPYRSWAIPGGRIAGDWELAQRLAAAVPGLELDAAAHQSEHAIEVQLPFLARLAPQTQLVGIVLQEGTLAELQRFAQQMAGVLATLPERPLLVISSDLNHYASEEESHRLDRLALDALESLDPARLMETVQRERITMCGALPAVLVLETLRRLGGLKRFEEVGYTTSAAVSGDRSRVVGYGGVLLE